MKIIEMIVSPEGQSRLETHGFAGSECQEASRFLESVLGKTTSETLTPQFHQTAVQQQSVLEQKE